MASEPHWMDCLCWECHDTDHYKDHEQWALWGCEYCQQIMDSWPKDEAAR